MNYETQEIDLGALLHGAAFPVSSSQTKKTDGNDTPSSNASSSVVYDSHVDVCQAMEIVQCHCQLGECVMYDDRNHCVYWTDILGKFFHKLTLRTSNKNKATTTTTTTDEHDKETTSSPTMVHTKYGPLPKKLCAFGLLEDAPPIIDDDRRTTSLPLFCAWEDGFQLYDIAKNQPLSEMSQGEEVNPLKGPTRLNDGRTSPTGTRFVCGGFYGDDPKNFMKVFSVEQQRQQDNGTEDTTTRVLKHTPIVDKIQTTNSICWSLDGKTMYLADSPTKTIYSHQYNQDTGTLSDKTVFRTIVPHKDVPETESSCVPDGSCVDSEGFVWNAVWNHGTAPSCVQRLDPKTGQVVFVVHVNTASQVSCCCFGGENLDILFITTAACDGKDQTEPHHAGNLYAAKVPFQGRKEARLRFQCSNTRPSAAATETGAEDEGNKRPRLE